MAEQIQPGPTQFVVTLTIKSPTSNPVDVTYYRGEDRVQALGALMGAATMDIRDTDMPESIRTTVQAVRMDVLPIECSGNLPGNASVPYCGSNTGGCAMHYPSEQVQAKRVSGNGATSSTDEHPGDCVYCAAGEPQVHNYEPPTEGEPNLDWTPMVTIDYPKDAAFQGTVYRLRHHDLAPNTVGGNRSVLAWETGDAYPLLGAIIDSAWPLPGDVPEYTFEGATASTDENKGV